MIIDQFLISAGMQLAIGDAAKRYGRAIADPGEPVLRVTEAQPSWSASPEGDQLRPASENLTPTGNRPGHTNVSDQ
jgi:hypothetical protein